MPRPGARSDRPAGDDVAVRSGVDRTRRRRALDRHGGRRRGGPVRVNDHCVVENAVQSGAVLLDELEFRVGEEVAATARHRIVPAVLRRGPSTEGSVEYAIGLPALQPGHHHLNEL